MCIFDLYLWHFAFDYAPNLNFPPISLFGFKNFKPPEVQNKTKKPRGLGSKKVNKWLVCLPFWRWWGDQLSFIFSCATIGPIIRKQCLRLNLVINYSFAKLTSTHTHLEKWCLSFIFSLEGIITEHFWPPCPFLKINTLIYIFLKNLNRDLFAHKNGYKQCPVGAKNLAFFPSFFADLYSGSSALCTL